MGSERKNKNTAKLLNFFNKRFIKAEDEVYEYILKDLKFSACISCYGCAKKPACIINDDLQDLYKLIEEVDAIVFSTPIYFNSVPAISKSFIDRMQVYWCRKFILKLPPIKEKIGIALINGGAPYYEEQFIGPELVFDHFFKSTTCKRRIFLELSNTDSIKIDEDNKELVSFLNNIDYSFKENKTYKL